MIIDNNSQIYYLDQRDIPMKELGIAVIGSGRIGSLRARLAAKHPSVKFLAIADQDISKAKL